MKTEWSDFQENNPPVAQNDSDFETDDQTEVVMVS